MVLMRVFFLGLLGLTRLGAQTFEVASIKPNKSGDYAGRQDTQPGGRFTATNVTLRFLIQAAYGRLPDFQVVGGPGWLDSERFDIAAKGESNPTPDQFNAMMRNLLADRFKLVIHNEGRELPVYGLVLARKDGKLGPQFGPAAFDCPGGRADVPPHAQVPAACGVGLGRGRLRAGGVSAAQVAQALSRIVNRVVIDQTGLKGQFDLNLTWTSGVGEFQLPGPPDVPVPAGDSGPSIFTAVQEQLGLKLDSQKGLVQVVVIDRAERPEVE